MLRLYDVDAARETILRRVPFDAMQCPPALAKGTERLFGPGTTPPQAVTQILACVRKEGDTALRHWSNILDKTQLTDFQIPVGQLEQAYSSLPQPLAQAMIQASDRIRAFHEHQPLPGWTTGELGGILGQRVTPIERIGIYVPGGTAPLPSSLLMSAIPALVAGVPQIIVCTPPRPHATILGAAYLCGIEHIYQIGGAQAIAAMAFGTESVPKVDKIVGAGNLFVTLAKQRVYGMVGLDGVAGPTETMVIADGKANPVWVAADLLAQAEHDALASAILLTPDRPLAEAVQIEIERQVETLSRADVIVQSLASRGGIVITPDLETAAAVADEYAPEHLCLAVADPHALAEDIRNAGGFFIGERSFEVLGDYVAGPSHIMPTNGTARFSSPLNVLDFVKISSIIALDTETSQALSPIAAELAQTESLTAHAAAATLRVKVAQSERPRPALSPDAQTSQTEAPAMFDPAHHIRSHVRELPAYAPVLPLEVHAKKLGLSRESIIKLDANENPYGPLPAVAQALAELPNAHTYPDPESRELCQALATHHQMPAANLLAGAGSDELIDLIMRLFLEPGDAIIHCPPTFGMYAFDAGVNGALAVSIPRTPDFALDLAAVERAVPAHRPKLLFLASPNNPDGGLLPAGALERLLTLPLVVVLDEAYVEFAPPASSRIRAVTAHENLIVLRTFSKWAGLAGLRVGYGAFPAGLMPHLWKIKQPYNVSVAAATAAIVSLQNAAQLEEIGQEIVAERERLYDALEAIPWLEPRPSQANFVLCRVLGRDAAVVKGQLAHTGILVRHFDTPGLGDHIRISVGRPEQTDALLARLAELE